MSDNTVLKVVIRIMLPFIIMYALYVLLHAASSPGGGFQAGVIFAAAFIMYSFGNDLQSLQKKIPTLALRIAAFCGVILYAGTGFASMYFGAKFLDYSVLFDDTLQGFKLSVMLVELGIGITVFSVIMLVFYTFGERSSDA